MNPLRERSNKSDPCLNPPRLYNRPRLHTPPRAPLSARPPGAREAGAARGRRRAHVPLRARQHDPIQPHFVVLRHGLRVDRPRQHVDREGGHDDGGEFPPTRIALEGGPPECAPAHRRLAPRRRTYRRRVLRRATDRTQGGEKRKRGREAGEAGEAGEEEKQESRKTESTERERGRTPLRRRVCVCVVCDYSFDPRE